MQGYWIPNSPCGEKLPIEQGKPYWTTARVKDKLLYKSTETLGFILCNSYHIEKKIHIHIYTTALSIKTKKAQ